MKLQPSIPEAAMITVEPDGLGIESDNRQWDRARLILESVKMTSRMNLAAQVMLGGELTEIRASLGFNGRGGDRRSKSASADLKIGGRTWEEWCKAELKISRDTADRCVSCFQVIKRRGEALGDAAPAFRLLCAPASTLDDEEYKILQRIVNELIEGNSQKDLLHELKILKDAEWDKGRNKKGSKKPADVSDEATAERASEFFRIISNELTETERTVSRACYNKSFESWLYLLPLEPADSPGVIGLRDYQRQIEKLHESLETGLQDLLANVGRAIEAKMEAGNPPSKKSPRRRKQPTKRKP